MTLLLLSRVAIGSVSVNRVAQQRREGTDRGRSR